MKKQPDRRCKVCNNALAPGETCLECRQALAGLAGVHRPDQGNTARLAIPGHEERIRAHCERVARETGR